MNGSGNGWRSKRCCRLYLQFKTDHINLHIAFFPQMKPEKQEVVDGDEAFVEIGVPKEWVEPLKALGFTTVDKLKEVEKPGKLANDLNGYNKKNKLGLKGLNPEVVAGWIGK